MADTIKRVYLIEATATDAVNELRRLQKEATATTAAMKATGTAAKGVGADAAEGAKGVDGFSFATNGAKRELLVLVHELSQGNYSRFGGSLLVLAERTNFASLAFSAAGLAAIGFGAIVIGIVTAIVSGSNAVDKFTKSLTLTGDAAGVTASSFKSYNQAISDSTGESSNNVRKLATEFVNSGQVGSTLYRSLLQASAQYAKLSGDDVEKVGAEFIKLAGDPTHGALELNKTVNFLTASTYELIRRTQEAGDVQGAAVIAADALSKALKDRQAPQLSAIGVLLEALAKGYDRIKQSALGLINAPTGEEKVKSLYADLAAAQAQTASLQDKSGDQFSRASANPTGNSLTLSLQKEADIRKQIQDQIRANVEASNKAITDSDRAATQAAAVDAQKKLDILDDRIKGANRLKKQLDDNAKEEAALIKGRKNIDPSYDPENDSAFQAQHAARVAQIQKDNLTPADKATARAFQDYLDNLTKENAALGDQIAQYATLGKVVDQSTLAKVKAAHDTPGNPNSRFSAAQEATVEALAAQQDAERAVIAGDKAHSTVQQRIRDLQTQATQEGTTAREQAVAAALGEQSRQAIAKQYDTTTEAYKADSAALVENVNKLQDLIATKKINQNDLAASEEIKNLQVSTDLIGKNTLERQLATNALKLQAEAAKESLADPASAGRFNTDADKNIEATNAAITANYNALRTFQAGAATAFSTYEEDAANAAKFSQGFIEGSLTQIEDVFTNFVKTGKLSFTSLFEFMADEFLKQAVKINLTNLLKGNEGDVTGFLSKIFGAIGGNTAGGGAASAAGGATGVAGTATAATSASASLSALGGSTAAAIAGIDLLGDGADFASDGIDLFVDGIFEANTSLASFIIALDTAAASAGGKVGVSGGAGAGDALADSGLLELANGGIMSSKGLLPVNAYSSGGVAKSPQLAIYGEGRMNEAYVPLPDGNSIPVTVSGNSSNDSNGGMNVTIENHNGSDVSLKKEKTIDGKDQLRIFVRAAKADILNDVYGGGDLDKALSAKYGVSRVAGTPRRGNFN